MASQSVRAKQWRGFFSDELSQRSQRTNPVIGVTIASAVSKILLWKNIWWFLQKSKQLECVVVESDSDSLLWFVWRRIMAMASDQSEWVPEALRVEVVSAAEGAVGAQADPHVPPDLGLAPAMNTQKSRITWSINRQRRMDDSWLMWQLLLTCCRGI